MLYCGGTLNDLGCPNSWLDYCRNEIVDIKIIWEVARSIWVNILWVYLFSGK